MIPLSILVFARRKIYVLLFCEVLILFVIDAFVEGLRAVFAGGEEVEANTTDVLLGLEVLRIVYLVAFDFELHRAPFAQLHLITITKMPVGNLS